MTALAPDLIADEAALACERIGFAAGASRTAAEVEVKSVPMEGMSCMAWYEVVWRWRAEDDDCVLLIQRDGVQRANATVPYMRCFRWCVLFDDDCPTTNTDRL